MVRVFAARFEVMHQIMQMFLPFFGRRSDFAFNKGSFKHLQSFLVKIFMNGVGVRSLIIIGPQAISIVILLNAVLDSQHFTVIFTRHAGERMDSVV